MNTEEKLLMALFEYYSGDPQRAQHAVKVHSFAALIASLEKLDERTTEIISFAAIVHDVGIKAAEAKYGRCNGALQEKEGPAIAEKMLREAGVEESMVERISFLVRHHHTYTGVNGIDWRILLEADFIVNAYEDNLDRATIETAYERIFETNTGRKILREMYML